jgi:glycosyltransferase involved in cell wall biosynthesis
VNPPLSRITFLVTGLSRGGAETQVVRLACRLAERGRRCRLLSLTPCNDFADELAVAGVPVRTLGLTSAFSLPGALRDIVGDLKTEPPQALVTFLYHANILGRVAARFASVPVVVSSIRSDNFGGRLRYLMTRATDGLCGLTTSNSSLVAERLVVRGVVPRGKLQVVPNAVIERVGAIPSGHIERIRESLDLGAGDFAWLSAGRLTEAKDHVGLLRSFAKLRIEFPGARLLIAGDGELQAAVRAEIGRLGLDDTVRMLGLRRDLPDLMRAADGLVLSSVWEGLPNVVLEALAEGLPVVATRVGGVPEILGQEYPWLANPGDPESLTAVMGGLMRIGESAWQRLGEQGQEIIRDRYGVDAVVDTWVKLLEDLYREKAQ